jgi:hypothetical protein
VESFTALGIPQRSFLRLRLLRADDRVVPAETPLARTGAPAMPGPAPEPELPSPLDVLPAAEQPPVQTYETYVSPGHPLFLTAFRLFGDPGLWRLLAQANPEVDPVFVPPGTPLRIPIGGKAASP